MIEAKIIEDSMAPNGKRLTTFQLMYPRFIHSEFMTHRMFSRNASSSRAIPVAKLIDQVRYNPAMPIHWGENQAGMQANQEIQHGGAAKDQWLRAARNAADVAEEMVQLNLHKQVVNRILEPFCHINVIVTATEWDNFFELRDHKDAQPEIAELAKKMRKVMNESLPVVRQRDRLHSDAWHLPYVTKEERLKNQDDPILLAKLSAARCARVSYLLTDGSTPNIEKDLVLYDRLVGSVPLHASPVEHSGYPLTLATGRSNNFLGWRQYRELVEDSFKN